MIRWLLLVGSTVALSASCTGQIGDPVTRTRGGADLATCDPSQSPDPGGLASPRRLTRDEMVATIEGLVGEPMSELAALLPADPLDHGFSNQVEALTLSPLHAQAYRDVAARVARTVLSSDALRARLLGCDPEGGPRHACLVAFAARFGRRAFRRPLEGDPAAPGADTELGRLVALGEAGQAAATPGSEDPLERFADVAAMLEAILQSPHFLLRLEMGVPIEGRPDVRLLTGYEVATRLSYFLWGDAPDDDLLDAAAEGHLDGADGIEDEARRRLEDERARAAFRRFFGQWFQLDALATRRFDATLFPAFGPALAASMRTEVERLLDDHAWAEDGRSFLDVYTASYGYADPELAALYGVPPPAAGEVRRVTFEPSQQRGGLLSTAAVLALTSKDYGTNPTGRGHYVRTWALCDEIPPPPPDVPLTAPAQGESPADTLNRHATDPVCAGCHERLDPIGLGLEMYDALGALRPDFDPAELRERRTYVAGLPEPDFMGAPELGRLVAATPMARECVVQQITRWALGRGLTDEDECELGRLSESFERSGESFRELVVQVVRSDAFRTLRVPADAGCE